jgi:hypothetical protein
MASIASMASIEKLTPEELSIQKKIRKKLVESLNEQFDNTTNNTEHMAIAICSVSLIRPYSKKELNWTIERPPCVIKDCVEYRTKKTHRIQYYHKYESPEDTKVGINAFRFYNDIIKSKNDSLVELNTPAREAKIRELAIEALAAEAKEAVEAAVAKEVAEAEARAAEARAAEAIAAEARAAEARAVEARAVEARAVEARAVEARAAEARAAEARAAKARAAEAKAAETRAAKARAVAEARAAEARAAVETRAVEAETAAAALIKARLGKEDWIPDDKRPCYYGSKCIIVDDKHRSTQAHPPKKIIQELTKEEEDKYTIYLAKRRKILEEILPPQESKTTSELTETATELTETATELTEEAKKLLFSYEPKYPTKLVPTEGLIIDNSKKILDIKVIPDTIRSLMNFFSILTHIREKHTYKYGKYTYKTVEQIQNLIDMLEEVYNEHTDYYNVAYSNCVYYKLLPFYWYSNEIGINWYPPEIDTILSITENYLPRGKKPCFINHTHDVPSLKHWENESHSPEVHRNTWADIQEYEDAQRKHVGGGHRKHSKKSSKRLAKRTSKKSSKRLAKRTSKKSSKRLAKRTSKKH